MSDMQQIQGKSIGRGIAVGRMLFYKKGGRQIRRTYREDSDAELKRLADAVEVADAQLKALAEQSAQTAGEENAAIFEAHRIMLRDEELHASIREIIQSAKVSAEYAVFVAEEHFSEQLSLLDDEYVQARKADVQDVSWRLIRILNGFEEMQELKEPSIIVAEDLTPSETIQFDRSLILGFVTTQGSANSHTAILARQMSLPAVCGVSVDPAWNGRMAVVDGDSGLVLIDPDEENIKKSRQRKREEAQLRERLQQLKGRPAIAKDGRHIAIYANIGSVEEAIEAKENDAEGIGLFRSEFLYLEGRDLPSEEKQLLAYKAVAEIMEGKPVVIRTLDLGADKQARYLELGQEENPAMGYRAIRICLDRPEIFRTQLRAIYRASVYGSVAILFPMIISIEEVRQCKRHIAEVKAELKAENIPYREDVQIGVMIETPAAALISDQLAGEVDFFSIGTNDLAQYTLAIDRTNARVEALADMHHPAVQTLIRQTVENGHKAGIRVEICGELAADTGYTKTFLDYGVDTLSVSSPYVLAIKDAVIHAVS